MFGLLAPIAAPRWQAHPPAALATPPGAAGNGSFRFQESIRNDSTPFAPDRQPFWEAGTFASREPDPEVRAPVRKRRVSVRPVWELLHVRTPLFTLIGQTDVGKALSAYAYTLWNIRQGQADRLGLARRLRMESVAALGGPGSARGAEFVRRCRLISRFVMHLSRLAEAMLNRNALMNRPAVREEADAMLGVALFSLTNGRPFAGATDQALQRAVACNLQRRETNWLTFLFYWIWAQFWC